MSSERTSPPAVSSSNNGSSPTTGSPPHGNLNGFARSAPLSDSNGHGTPLNRTPSTSSEERDRVLEKLHIEPGPMLMVGKLPHGTLLANDREVQVVTNIYPLTASDSKHVFPYQITWKKSAPDFEPRLLYRISKKRRIPDAFIRDRRMKHRQLLNMLLTKKAESFGNDISKYLYDYASYLYSIVDLGAGNLSYEFIMDEPLFGPFINMLAEMTPTLPFFDNDYSGITLDLAKHDDTLIRFKELATSHYAAENPDEYIMFNSNLAYFVQPTRFDYASTDSPDLGVGKYLAVGTSKSAIPIEGPQDDPVIAVAIDSKKTVFWKSQRLIDTAANLIGLTDLRNFPSARFELIRRILKGLVVRRDYGDITQPFVIHDLSSQNATTALITIHEEEMTVAEFFERRYNIRLEHPTWPLVLHRRGKVTDLFPMEMLMLVEHQRASNIALSSTEISKIIKYCAIPPSQKSFELSRSFNAWNIANDSLCKEAGIGIDPNPIEVTARVLTKPQISYANGLLNPEDSGEWRIPPAAKFSSTSIVKRWGVLLICDLTDKNEVDRKMMVLAKFLERYVQSCKQRGIEISMPNFSSPCGASEGRLIKAFHDAHEGGQEFLMIIEPDDDIFFHGIIKTLERRYTILTQCLRMSTIVKIVKEGKPVTMENIIAKTNVKLGGINYDILMHIFPTENTTLYIGFSLNQPTGGYGLPASGDAVDGKKADQFAVLGVAANDTRRPNAFVGNFFLQPAYNNKYIRIFDDVLREILDRYLTNRGHPPTRVIIYRSGASEGEYGKILSFEIPIIHNAVQSFAPGIPISVIVPTKLHGVRILPQEIDPSARARDQNIVSGTCIDRVAVHHKFAEFYLNSHIALQGTAKVPKFTILYTTEAEATLDMFERWTYALAFDFQIIDFPVSLPAPSMIAERYATRGRQILNNQHVLGTVLDGTCNFDLVDGEEDDPLNDKYMNRSLKYNFTKRSSLRNRRINA